MVQRIRSPAIAALVAALVATTLATTGCTQAVNAGLALLGVNRSDTPGAPSSAKPDAQPLGTARNTDHDAVIGGFEWAPSLEWQRWAVGQPYSPARFLSGSLGPQAMCTPTGAGLSRVLPVTTAGGGDPIASLGPLDLRVANQGGDLFWHAWRGNSASLAQASMSRVAEMGTHGEGCSTNIFAYVTLASWGTSDPVVVR